MPVFAVSGPNRRAFDHPRVPPGASQVLFVVISDYAQQYLAQFPNLAAPALMFISESAPTSGATVFLEPADDATSSTNTVRATWTPSGLRGWTRV